LQQRTQKNGVLTQAQLDAKLAEQRQELEFERFIDNNPSMGQFKDALKTL
jgi:regulatory protein YycH of two-component signal transduction system YycFG